MNPKPLQKEDRAGVVGMLGERVRMLQGLTADRNALRSALREAGVRFGVALRGTDVSGPWTVDLATGIEKACAELDRQGVSDHRRAILVVFGSDDPGLRTRQASLRSVLKSANQPVTPPGVIVRPRPLYPVLTAREVSHRVRRANLSPWLGPKGSPSGYSPIAHLCASVFRRNRDA